MKQLDKHDLNSREVMLIQKTYELTCEIIIRNAEREIQEDYKLKNKKITKEVIKATVFNKVIKLKVLEDKK